MLSLNLSISAVASSYNCLPFKMTPPGNCIPSNLIKFEGMQLPGGVILNGRQLYDDATAEIERLRESMRLEQELPPDFFVG